MIVWRFRLGMCDTWIILPDEICSVLEEGLENKAFVDFEWEKDTWKAELPDFVCYTAGKRAFLQRKQVSWESRKENATEWEPYHSTASTILEYAVENKLPTVPVQFLVDGKLTPYIINIQGEEWFQYREKAPSFRRHVRRICEVRPEVVAPTCALWAKAKACMESLQIPDAYWDKDGNACFCRACFPSFRDRSETRGNPPKKYAIPVEWCRFGVAVHKSQCEARRVFQDWHVCYHGTSSEGAKGIITGGSLLMPGDFTYTGYQISIERGHILSTFERKNDHTGQMEKFDPNQMFTSPAIDYCSYKRVYTKPYKFNDENWLIVLQLRIQPDGYNVGQQTVGATDPISGVFSNSELEWYTKRRGVHVVTGLLLKKDE